jgi:hypothetical protein
VLDTGAVPERFAGLSGLEIPPVLAPEVELPFENPLHLTVVPRQPVHLHSHLSPETS